MTPSRHLIRVACRFLGHNYVWSDRHRVSLVCLPCGRFDHEDD